ncbi:hypothetical protein OAG24_01265 [bacterium]|nr:hypothetical protein [bacterium]
MSVIFCLIIPVALILCLLLIFKWVYPESVVRPTKAFKMPKIRRTRKKWIVEEDSDSDY